MLKFKDNSDRIKLLVEIDRIDLLDNTAINSSTTITEDVFNEFIKRRRRLIPKLKNFRRSQTTKQQWRTNKWKIMKGIKKFHRSIAGKRFHRSLGRFLSTRYIRPSLFEQSGTANYYRDVALKAISSIKTHLYIEQGYYHTVDDQVDLEILTEYSVPLLTQIEKKLFNDVSEELVCEELEILLHMIDEKVLVGSLLEVSDVSSDEFSKRVGDAGEDIVGNFLTVALQLSEINKEKYYENN